MVVVAGDQRRTLSPVEGDVPCDLALVQRLLWLRLRAQRMGWRLHLEDVDDELAALLDLVGVGDCLGVAPHAST